VLEMLCPETKTVERLMRRIENPDIPGRCLARD
jgi:hypothetical protein